jgi:hypothetical protein
VIKELHPETTPKEKRETKEETYIYGKKGRSG